MPSATPRIDRRRTVVDERLPGTFPERKMRSRRQHDARGERPQAGPQSRPKECIQGGRISARPDTWCRRARGARHRGWVRSRGRSRCGTGRADGLVGCHLGRLLRSFRVSLGRFRCFHETGVCGRLQAGDESAQFGRRAFVGRHQAHRIGNESRRTPGRGDRSFGLRDDEATRFVAGPRRLDAPGSYVGV